MTLVLIEHVIDDLFACPAHNIVILTAFCQMDFGAPVVLFVCVAARGAYCNCIIRQSPFTGINFVDEVHFTAVENFDAYAVRFFCIDNNVGANAF